MAPFAKSRHHGRWVWGMRTGTCVTLPPPWESGSEDMKVLLGLVASP